METNLRFFSVAAFLLLFSNGSMLAQNTFFYTEIDKRRDVGLVSYSGGIRSIAEDTAVELSAFNYLSIGKIKKLIAVSNGCVYVLIEYPQKQFILVKSEGELIVPTIEKWEWENATLAELNVCLDTSDEVNESNGRTSLFMKEGPITVAVLNVKQRNIEVFKYMARSLSYN